MKYRIYVAETVFYSNEKKLNSIQVSQNSRIPNSERGREGPSGARKILRKKILSS
jgi:hypothetical protein